MLGAPFFVMEHVAGNIPSDDPSFAAPGSWVLSLDVADRELLVNNGLKTLVSIHRLDWQSLGLNFAARTFDGNSAAEKEVNYYEDFYTWTVGTDRCPVIDEALSWAKANQPTGEELVLSWGDSRIGNMIFGDDLSVSAVIDWEGATLSSPEKDLGHWIHLSRVFSQYYGFDLPEGFPSRDEIVGRYEELSGRTTRNVHFYEVLSGIHGSIQANRALRLMMESGVIPKDKNALDNNPFTRSLADLIGHVLPESEGLAVISGKG
ncbi:aminoglycoside phosphotransferase (APT) family kinase protein [Rhodococcus sp. 27YEA15]|uniref:phosphotransferase family protein n=1 Tax=Rhodococcus sp. 27YEA15 TaxID=3156259 RepID=UPI003C7EC327